MEKVALITEVQRAERYTQARVLARQGAHVVVASADWSRAIDAALRLQLEGLSAEALHLPAGAAAMTAARQQILRRRGRLDLVVDAPAPVA